MPNNYFQFKKFIIHQDKCSMKVCTDSCLFGAWIANKIVQKIFNPKNILDIGTGTGLLSLMLAQKTNAQIDAVEIENNAYEQASENFKLSPWQERLKIFHADIKRWNAPRKYDLVISNPPFYENDLASENEGKNISKHSGTLLLKELLSAINNFLNEDGIFAVLTPAHRTQWIESIAQSSSLFVKEKINVQQTTRHNYFRTMFLLQKKKSDAVNGILSIKNDKNDYTTEFTGLLKDYYLYL